MKKVLTIVAALAVLVASSSMALAKPTVDPEKFTVVGGVTYNSSKFEPWQDGVQYEWTSEYAPVADTLSRGTGGYLGGEYWFSEKVGVGTGGDMFISRYNESTNVNGVDVNYLTSNINYGPYASLVYKPAKYLKLHGGLAYYTYNEKLAFTASDGSSDSLVTEKGGNVGLLFGGQLAVPVTQNVSIAVDYTYRKYDAKVSEVYNFQTKQYEPYGADFRIKRDGMRLSLGVNASF